MTTRARKNGILIALNTMGGKVVDMTTLADGYTLVYDEATDRYTHVAFPTGGGVNNYPTEADFPATGDPSQIYLDESTYNIYTWSLTEETYVIVGGGGPVYWEDILNTPTTLVGYGITDAYNKTEIGQPTTDYVPYFEAELL